MLQAVNRTNAPRSLSVNASDCFVLRICVYDNFVSVDKLLAKVLRKSFETCLSVTVYRAVLLVYLVAVFHLLN